MGRAIILDPATYAADNQLHISYYHDELALPSLISEELLGGHADEGFAPDGSEAARAQQLAITALRSYRIAIATDGEYAQQQGGTLTSTLSSVVSRLSDINLVYESQLGIQLLLIANNANIIFTDPATDPFPQSSSRTSLMETNRTVLTTEIGDSNFDVGHLFSGQLSGGVAYIGAVCNETKGGGMSGLNNLRVMLHELGHQFDADHSMNGDKWFLCWCARRQCGI